MDTKILALSISAFLMASSSPWATARAQEEEESTRTGRYEQLMESVTPSLVTVRLVVKVEMAFQGRSRDNESRDEIPGVVVSNDGLIMCGYDSFRSIDGEGFTVKRTPLEVKVVFDREEKEYDAELIATDQKVNLAFIKIKDLESREPPVLSFADGHKPQIGEVLLQVTRLEKGYDYAPQVLRGIVSGKVKKPRKALLVDGPLNAVSLPVFTGEGQVAGVVTRLESGMADPSNPFGGFGGISVVIDGNVIAKLIEQAQKQAAEMAAEESEG